MILALVSEIDPSDSDFKIYRFKVNDLAELLNVDKNHLYSDIIKITEDIASKVLKIYDPKSNSTLVTNWFSSAEYFNDKGIAEFSFDPKLKPYLLQLKSRFTSYQLKNIVQLKSIYSIRFYELLKQYEKIGYRSFELKELKEILGLKNDEYSMYAHFKTRILNKAKEELIARTDIRFTYTPIKEARKVCYIRFDIFPNIPGEEVIDEKESITDDEVRETSIDFDVINNPDFVTLIRLVPQEHQGKTTIINLITHYFKKGDLKYIERNIKYSNQNYKTNYQAYLNKSLKADWGLELQEEEEARAKKAKDKEAEIIQQKAKEAEEEAKNKQIADYIKVHEAELREEAINQLDEAVKKELENDTATGRLALEGQIYLVAAAKLA